jgi:hypothetical protein
LDGLNVGVFWDDNPNKLSKTKQSILIFLMGPLVWIGLVVWMVVIKPIGYIWRKLP